MKNIITVSREFGSGGRSIAKNLAETLGYAYYDKEIIEKMVKETGLSKDFLEKRGEYATGNNLFSYAFVGRMPNGESLEDIIWKNQRELVLKLAEKGKCVIVGRCADFILADRTDCLHVFIHADEAYKMDRIVRLYGETDTKPQKRLRDKDKKRSVNYKYYTGRDWGKASNYHVCLKSSEFGTECCVEILKGLAQ